MAAETTAIFGHRAMGFRGKRGFQVPLGRLTSSPLELSRTALRASSEATGVLIRDVLPAKWATTSVDVRGGDEEEMALPEVPRQVLTAEHSALIVSASHLLRRRWVLSH